MAERKTVRIEDLPEDIREKVEQLVDERAAEDRLRKLIEGNTRLLDAAEAVWDEPEHGDGDVVRRSVAIFETVMFQEARRRNRLSGK